MQARDLDRAELLERLVPVAREAGRLVLDVYATDFVVRGKVDASPVTVADEAAEQLIVRALAAITPGVPVVAEESFYTGKVPAVGHCFWLVDPLDGTQEFISRNGEFTINIALVEHGSPVVGVVFAPALDRLFGGACGGGAFVEEHELRRPICVRSPPASGLTVVASRSHGDPQALADFLQGRRVAKLTTAGSSLKLCLVASGEADLYPRLGRTMEWDIAAGHAVLAAAGGSVCTMDGKPLLYGKPGFSNPHFLAGGAA